MPVQIRVKISSTLLIGIVTKVGIKGCTYYNHWREGGGGCQNPPKDQKKHKVLKKSKKNVEKLNICYTTSIFFVSNNEYQQTVIISTSASMISNPFEIQSS